MHLPCASGMPTARRLPGIQYESCVALKGRCSRLECYLPARTALPRLPHSTSHRLPAPLTAPAAPAAAAATPWQDNEKEGKATDMLLNYETVKLFTNEQYELDHYGRSIDAFQAHEYVQLACISLLNIAQSALVFVGLALGEWRRRRRRWAAAAGGIELNGNAREACAGWWEVDGGRCSWVACLWAE